jgi:hypothetical protein
MTTSLPPADADARARAQKLVDDMFASLDASEPWEVEMMYAKADALIWIRDVAGLRPTPPLLVYKVIGAAVKLRRAGPCPNPSELLIEVAREAVREYRSSVA